MYPLPFIEVLGLVTCQTTSKCLGIRFKEWSWSDVKTIKNRKHANISSESLEKRDILYTYAKLEETQLLRNLDAPKYPDHDAFGNNDLK